MARLLALLVCALAQSHALVVSGHAGALIRSGVSTPKQQLCRWTAPSPTPASALKGSPCDRGWHNTLRAASTAWIA